MKKKWGYVGGAVLVGIAICMSVWFFLREHKAQQLQGKPYLTSSRQYKGVTTENRNGPQQGQNPDKAPIPIEEIARRMKINLMSRHSEEQLAKPEIQKRLAVMDSPEFLEFMKDTPATGHNLRKWNDFWESQGFPVKRGYPEIFRHHFPTGEPEDYDKKMRLKIADMFFATEPVNLTDPEVAASQRREVIRQLIRKGGADVAWYLGRFGDEWDGPILFDQENTRGNAATEWVKDVQRNAASIVAAAEESGGKHSDEIGTSVPSWDLSSVMESSSAFHSEMERPTTLDTKEHAIMADAETEAAIEQSLTPQPSDMSTNQRPEPRSEIQSNLETTLKAQFSSERFDRVMSTLEQYGPEEGLRRLRENDPEVANQIERYRNRESVPRSGEGSQ